MRGDAAVPALIAMLHHVDRLPGAQRQRAVDHRDRKAGVGESRLHVRRHVIGPLGAVPPVRVAGRKAVERIQQVRLHVGISVFLNHQRRRRVLDEEIGRAHV